MLFNSIPFLVFLPIVFICYWLIGSKRYSLQNLLLLGASYVFYGWWDYRFLSLIILSSIVDFIVGKKIESSPGNQAKKRWLYVSVLFNLGLLGFFKYFNFFVDSFASAFGLDSGNFTLQIILPVGISFYTFQTLSYCIDIYRNRIKATQDPIAFFTFVAFFPQLVAGPIERAKDLLPQFLKSRKFDYSLATDGLRQMLWGFFKKMVVADNCAVIVDEIFANYTEFSALTLWLGAILFAFQIYCDFSGYSDIAIGTARLFGIKLKQNFAFPYFSRDLAEFWRRWHISLSSWFRDYLYIPFGGSRGAKGQIVLNVFLVFLVSGLWHGANWTFVVWGGVHAALFIPLILFEKNRNNISSVEWRQSKFPKELLKILSTFLLVTLTWVIFRSPDLNSAFQYLQGMFISNRTIGVPFELKIIFLSIVILLLFEWINRKKFHGLHIKSRLRFVRWSVYLGLCMLILLIGKMDNTSFIYFAF